jgi:hypothetical protein
VKTKMSFPSGQKMISAPKLAKVWGVSVNKVLAFIRSGELRAMNLATRRSGRPRYAISLSDVEAFEQARQVLPNVGNAKSDGRRSHASGAVTKFF